MLKKDLTEEVRLNREVRGSGEAAGPVGMWGKVHLVEGMMDAKAVRED